MSNGPNLLPKVIEYLSKKGYTKTEATLRAESAAQEADGRPLSTNSEDLGGAKYRQGFGERKKDTVFVLHC